VANNIIQQYEEFTLSLESTVYNHLAMKLAAFKGFHETLNTDLKKTLKSFPLLYFMLESLQVDCVMTTSKLTENKRGDKTIQKFLNFAQTNLSRIQEKFPDLSEEVIFNNLQEIKNVQEQITRIKTQRDKYYAHADNAYFLEPQKLLKDFPNTYDDLADITNSLQLILHNHIYIIKGHWRLCTSDLAYFNTFRTMEFLNEGSEKWLKKYRPDETV
jgi:hypothetical protein